MKTNTVVAEAGFGNSRTLMYRPTETVEGGTAESKAAAGHFLIYAGFG